ncbi:hypothetical protein BVC80_1037g5 [Macleaya cordata]|uniref:Uncharacterized protein n=1 Tax=Macleaya cordata TaxID=56857 RepID=A0A200QVI8_MACCD|nr:hypothetical protein BVC80_1037g5 [Macleaya cordata]
MAEQKQNPNSLNPKVSNETSNSSNKGSSFSGQKPHYQNPPDASIPDAATLRDQWRFAIRQYSRWYSQAWGTAILAGVSFFALGWIIKGSNPLPSRQEDPPHNPDHK